MADVFYRQRDRAGREIRLIRLDEATIAPRLDAGGQPTGDYMQWIADVPWNVIPAGDLVFEREAS